jgi:dTDP-4-amino-4,6-dideoxy-D-galactose acyltransferase
MPGKLPVTAASWRRLDWDSDFFGIPIGRIDLPPDAGREDIEAALRAAREVGLACLYAEAPFGSPLAVTVGRLPGATLTDVKTTLVRSVRPDENRAFEDGIRLGAGHEDRGRLAEIVEQVALMSRFRHDPRFGEPAARRLYREWLRRSLDEGYADEILVSERDGGATGFLTLNHKAAGPAIVLFGVHAAERGRGWGGRLLRAAGARAAVAGASRLSVVTQGHNIEALRAYIRSGFNIATSNLFFHLWPEEG